MQKAGYSHDTARMVLVVNFFYFLKLFFFFVVAMGDFVHDVEAIFPFP